MKKKKILSLLLALVMVLDMLPRFALPVVAEDQPEQGVATEETTPGAVQENYITGFVSLSCEENDSQAVLEQGDKIYVFTTLDPSLGEQSSYAWQMMTSGGAWATISGYVMPYAVISDALLASATLEDGEARLRCVVDGKYVSQVLHISQAEREIYIEPEMAPITPEIEIFTDGALTATEDMQSTQGEQQTEGGTQGGSPAGATDAFQIVITYNYRHATAALSLSNLDGATAANTFTVSLPSGGNYTGTVATPLEVGYLPYVKEDQASYVTGYDATSPFQTITYDGEDYVLANSIEFKNQSDNITIEVFYIPQQVTYRVKIYEQNLYDDEYTLAETKTKYGIANAAVGTGHNEGRPGFTSLYYDPNLPIAEDGSFAVDIYYDRNYYLVNFDLNANGEAYGAPNHYVRYETPVTLATPTRPGHSFVEWTLVSVQDENRQDLNQHSYKASVTGGYLISSVKHNLNYRANWKVETTSYTIIYWLENANDSNFTLDSFKVVNNVTPGAVVSATDSLSIDDKDCFTFNPTLSDQNVTVAADGTTAVNAYYLRNYYTLTYKGNTQCITEEHTHSASCNVDNCGITAHTHSEACGKGEQNCNQTEHIHSAICCVIPAHAHDTTCCSVPYHVHSKNVSEDCDKPEHIHHTTCYSRNNLTAAESLSGDPLTAYSAISKSVKAPQNGTVYRIRVTKGGTIYNFLYVHEQWFYLGTGGTYNGVSSSGSKNPGNAAGSYNSFAPATICNQVAHTHGDGTCRCEKLEHDHTSGCDCTIQRHLHIEGNCECGVTVHRHTINCYTFNCNLTSHTHTGDCVRTCQQLEHTHSTTCNNDATKEFLTVKCKYDSDISQVWEKVDEKFNNGERWKANTHFSQVLVYVPFMVPKNITFTVDVRTTAEEIYNMHYYLESLTAGEYELNKLVKANYNYLTKDEDFFDIVGFTQLKSDPAFNSNNQIETNKGGDVKLYYSRNSYDLDFVSLGTTINSFTKTLKYQQPIGTSCMPNEENIPYPSNEEPGAVRFAGWYTTPNCAEGTEFFFDGTVPMPLGGMVLYAKWVPCTYTLIVYKDVQRDEIIGDILTVPFGTMVQEPQHRTANDLLFVSMGKVIAEFTQTLRVKTPIDSTHKPSGTITPPIIEGVANVQFAGWYTTADCVDGSEFAFDGTTTMPVGGMVLYAKWTDENGVQIENPPAYAQEEQLIFAGWYYIENGKEKRFDFNTMSIKKDMSIYAKWTSRIPVPYTIYYECVCPKVEHTHVETCYNGEKLNCGMEAHTHQNDQKVYVAESTTGYSLAGLTKTFYAKVGEDLYTQYRKGYYPDMRVHSMTMSSDPEENVYRFNYSVPQKIKYKVTHQFAESAVAPAAVESEGTSEFQKLVGGTVLEYVIEFDIDGAKIAESAAYVMVSFRDFVNKETIAQAAGAQRETPLTSTEADKLWSIIKGLSPSHYVQELTLTTNDENNVVFQWEPRGYYVPYQVIHYIESLDGSEYTVEHISNYTADVREGSVTIMISDVQMEMDGFQMKPYHKEEGFEIVTEPNDDDPWSAALVIELYYDRVWYSCTVKHYKEGTSTSLVEDTTYEAKFETQVAQSALATSIQGYVLVDDGELVKIRGDEEITLYYRGLEVNYVYQVDPMDVSAYFDDYTDTVTIGAGQPEEHTLTIPEHAGHVLDKWTYDTGDGQRQPVPADWIKSENPMTVQPTAPSVDWAGKTIYIYAELIPTTRRFSVEGFVSPENDPQAFVFNLKGTEEATKHIDLTFFIFDNSYLDIEHLPYGQYTLTTLHWAWRYGHPTSVKFNNVETNTPQGTVELDLNTTGDVIIIYPKTPEKTQWITDDASGVVLIDTAPPQTPEQS